MRGIITPQSLLNGLPQASNTHRSMSQNQRRSKSRKTQNPQEFTELSSSFSDRAPRQRAPKRAVSKPKRSAAKSARSHQIEEEQKVLHAQIGALEGFIAGSPARDQKKRIKDPAVIPPPEQRGRRRALSPGSPAGRQRACYAQQQRRHRQRDQHVLVFFALFVGACWLAWWLLNTAGA